ncbi:5-formyltetrahydrofolate cyclo-ligase [Candidatus Nitrososphaera evergladensis SR1]|uniref:5-formyltetrahydrofolate cyclo-ligase n=1 Tax=Candidatus Nitrososphaera evergladensis SR1 TaxID=1459636 RepID=A0A075MU27_9ARCH|nr:5-formyltetrahydrofolate cyclo-ligase [Candidatus Nitrososphaera evergladensis SR1]
MARRDALAPLDIEQQSVLVQESVAQSKEFEQAQVIGAYYPKGSEVRTALLIGIAKDQGKKVALPRTEGSDMRFYEYEPADKLVQGNFGIMEPAPKRLVQHIDLVLVPGVAFDRKGCRIGYGKGYYDRFISEGRSSFSMGLAYSIQIVNEGLPSGRLDRKLDALATENGIMYF